ncbi:MAG TPA: hypothetical protein ENH59_01495 [Bacteroidetes bacterium]|nr:hypothetical protein [Bacteroidota bacterium]
MEFKAIFSGKHLIKPIRWQKDIKELSYLIKTLKNKKKLTSNYASTTKGCYCFRKEDGKPCTKDELNGCHNPSEGKAKKIEDIVENTL